MCFLWLSRFCVAALSCHSLMDVCLKSIKHAHHRNVLTVMRALAHSHRHIKCVAGWPSKVPPAEEAPFGDVLLLPFTMLYTFLFI